MSGEAAEEESTGYGFQEEALEGLSLDAIVPAVLVIEDGAFASDARKMPTTVPLSVVFAPVVVEAVSVSKTDQFQ